MKWWIAFLSFGAEHEPCATVQSVLQNNQGMGRQMKTFDLSRYFLKLGDGVHYTILSTFLCLLFSIIKKDFFWGGRAFYASWGQEEYGLGVQQREEQMHGWDPSHDAHWLQQWLEVSRRGGEAKNCSRGCSFSNPLQTCSFLFLPQSLWGGCHLQSLRWPHPSLEGVPLNQGRASQLKVGRKEQ